jgi:hypothetical protein
MIRALQVMGVLAVAAALGLWVGVMWASVEKLDSRTPETDGPPAVITTDP